MPATAPCPRRRLQPPAHPRSTAGKALGQPAAAPGHPSPSQVPLSEQRGALPRRAPRLLWRGRGAAQTLNFSGVQSLRCLGLPAAPAPPPDAHSPAVALRPGIGSRSLRVSLGERIAAPVRAAGGETRALRQGPGRPAPAQPAAREAAAGAYGAERRGGAGRGAGSPWTCMWGEESGAKGKRRRGEPRLHGAAAASSALTPAAPP